MLVHGNRQDYISFLEWRAVVLIQTWRGYLTQKVTQESSADNAIDLVKGIILSSRF